MSKKLRTIKIVVLLASLTIMAGLVFSLPKIYISAITETKLVDALPSDLYAANAKLASRTVKVVTFAENSGGTGVILRSDTISSLVLTNVHVCKLLEKGGKVMDDNDRSFSVIEYRPSKVHDLCLITVSGNLHVDTPIAEQPPLPYEEAIVVGHPSLMNTIITRGHFSKKTTIQVMMELKKCTEEDYKGPNAIMCIFGGGIPVLRTFNAQAVSATIKPGSSGSAVYNAAGQLSGLVFAGSGELDYGYIVPYEYIIFFLGREISDIAPLKPADVFTLGSEKAEAKRGNVCDKVKDKELKQYCSLLEKIRSL